MRKRFTNKQLDQLAQLSLDVIYEQRFNNNQKVYLCFDERTKKFYSSPTEGKITVAEIEGEWKELLSPYTK